MVTLWDESSLLWCFVLFFPEAVPFPTRSSSICPSSVSSLISFRGCRLRSLRCLSIYGCFVSAFSLLYSVRRSLFLSWSFFICTTSVSRVISLRLFAWIRSALSIGGCRSLRLFCVLPFSFRSALLDCLLLLPLLSFAILQCSSVGFFVISFLTLGFLPSGSLRAWSLWVSFFWS